MEKKTRYIIIALCCVFGIILGSTTAWYTWTSSENTDVTFTIGGVTVNYEAGDHITKNLRPTSNKESTEHAIQKEITVSSNKKALFDLYIKAETFPEILSHESFRWEIYEGETLLNRGSFVGLEVGESITILDQIEINNTVRNLKLYIWIDGVNYDNPEGMGNQNYSLLLSASATDEGTNIYKDPSGANAPELMSGMVPVEYLTTTDGVEEDGWYVADETKEWYNYSEQRWANAILIKNNTGVVNERNKEVNIANPVPTNFNSGTGNREYDERWIEFKFTTGNDGGMLKFDYRVTIDGALPDESFNFYEYSAGFIYFMLNGNEIIDMYDMNYDSSYSTLLESNTEYILTFSTTMGEEFWLNLEITNLSLPTDLSVDPTCRTAVYDVDGYKTIGEWEIDASPLKLYSSYDTNEEGNFVLEDEVYSLGNSAFNKYMCVDGSNECSEIYQVKEINGNTITKVDSYNVQDGFRNLISAGDLISEVSILAHYVWIPRYGYELFNANKIEGHDEYNAETTGIHINFENRTHTTGVTDCTVSSIGEEICINAENGNYYTHPAFWWDSNDNGIRETSEELTGIWVGKFEISSSEPDLNLEDGDENRTDLKIRVKPNVNSFGTILSNSFTLINKMTELNNEYGLKVNETDSHMIKNMEWGAVAYLTNSKYGRCPNDICTEVAKNGSSKTGGGDYITNIGQSTTNNVTGIYDMAGGMLEYTMGTMIHSDGESMISGRRDRNSGFNGILYSMYVSEEDITKTDGVDFPPRRYYDLYPFNDRSIDYSVTRTHLGDATGEIFEWIGSTNGTSNAFLAKGYGHMIARSFMHYSPGHRYMFSYYSTFGESLYSTRAILISA